GLIQQMQSNSTIPLAVAIDQEGGTVDRLVNLDGARRSATSIGLTNDPTQATAAGVQDAQDLSSYGINLNLAPVVDVTNVYNSQMYLRTFGDNPTLVTKMAAAYLQGLQQSGKVLGTLKHFPGLGDVTADPHSSVPHLNRSLSQLEAIDWAPYRSLIQQGNIHAIMVTHEIVSAVDASKPSSLSYKLVTGILRNQLGFNGVIMTDSLTMEGITAYYTEAQAAALAIEAGSDILMGASTPNDVANMITGIKQAMAAGEISQQRIDDSVSRILMLKYQMGLLHIPTT
ncbi:MAG TPA: glycoside hydrolase family 3 N-terminal domain-containing protein, partial [Ktedonobacteraceae bacterium]|nr:glycoside hydrolase family 3 N-terminal domain-containing protein [Ktedonobacteraceae bacterium]